ncbi:hypothetical protein [Bordetella sp. 15P40C-2]|uniref:hypothetical protein n=1 Tax=Bordetella sp. 15P40C-2 TaxID=2572246 RepID=UPI00132612A5|nr:hypothetical protein [Bordetella sp. 15P40C-2]MVW71329.1 hypothetical protein [Bordetella sp. 15P40C-2]
MSDTQEIVEQLKRIEASVSARQEIEELTSAELDEISGARRDWFVKANWPRAF